MVFAYSGVVVEAQPCAERERAQGDCVLRVDRRLFDVGVAVENEHAAAARQVERQQAGQERVARRVVENRVGDAELESLGQKSV